MYINKDIDYLKFLKGKKIYIFGCGVLGKAYAEKLKEYEIAAFIDNNVEKQGSLCLGHTVIGLDRFTDKNAENAMIILCSVYEREMKEQLLKQGIFNFISAEQIDFGGAAEYYDEQYFEWQKAIGKFGAKKKISYFTPYIKEDMTVLEHCENPFLELKELRKKLRKGGFCVFHVPNEPCSTEYTRSEINNHLYTWNALNLGNLFKAAGFFVKSVERIISEWPDHFEKIDTEVSAEFFDDLCKLKGHARENSITTCLIAAYK